MRNPGLRRLSMKRRQQSIVRRAHTIPNLFYLQKKTLSSIIAQKRRSDSGFFPVFSVTAVPAAKKYWTVQHDSVIMVT